MTKSRGSCYSTICVLIFFFSALQIKRVKNHKIQSSQLAGNAKSGHFCAFSNGTPCIYYVHWSYVYDKGKKRRKIFFLDMLGSEPAATSITNFEDFSVLYSGLKSMKKCTYIKEHLYILVLPFYLSIFVRTKHLHQKNLVSFEQFWSIIGITTFGEFFQSIICIRLNFLGNFPLKNDPKNIYNLIKYHIYNLELIDMSKFICQQAASMYNSKTWTDHLSQLWCGIQ